MSDKPLSVNQTQSDQPSVELHSILLVDDDSFLLDMYASKFKSQGFEVHTASNAEQALDIIRGGFEPHVALFDVTMPGMSGLELLQIVRDEKLLIKSSIIMLTNQGSDNEIAEAKKHGVDGYIVKAMTIPSEVLEEVKNIHEAKHQ